MIKKRIDRKAWIRIIEAFLAILIIMGVVLVVMARNEQRVDISDDVYKKQRQILDIISKNDVLRGEILLENNTGVNNKISQMAPSSWNFATRICLLDEICANPIDIHEQEVYSTEVVIAANLTEYNLKKLRFFVWIR